MSKNRTLANLADYLDSAAAGGGITKRDNDFFIQSLTDSDVGGSPVTGLTDSSIIKGLITTSDIVQKGKKVTTAAGLKTILQGSITNFNPSVSATYDLGDSSNPLDEIILDSASSLFFGALSMTSVLTSGTSAIAAAAAAATFYGDRGVIFGGSNANSASYNNIGYIDITSTGNATDFGDLSLLTAWTAAVTNGTYGLTGGGYNWGTSTSSNVIDYVTIATPGNASDFGDMLTLRFASVGISDATYGIYAGGYDTSAQAITIEYVTVATPGNASDFGDMTLNKSRAASACDGSRGIIAGGFDTSFTDHIDYITTATPGNATDFGDLTTERYEVQGVHDETYGVFSGGDGVTPGAGSASPQNIIDYITIQTTSNATDFGDLTTNREKQGGTGCTNATRGVFLCGSNNSGSPSTSNNINTLDYITIATPGNATDFGDHTIACQYAPGTSGSPS